MHRVLLLFFLLVGCFIPVAFAQTAAPKPGPELEKLHVFVGHWIGHMEIKPGPWGPGGKLPPWRRIDQMILRGFFLQTRDIAEDGEDLVIVGYDPANKNYPEVVYYDNGDFLEGTKTCEKNIWRFTPTRKITIAGKQYALRFTQTFAEDGMSRIDESEVSSDGKTWMPFGVEKYTKIKPAAKK